MKQENVPTKTSKGSVFISERLRLLDSKEYFTVIATESNLHPYTSLVNFALTPDCKKVIFATSKKTRKYRNIIKTKSVALLIDNRSKKTKKLMDTEAVTVVGNARPLRRGKSWEAFAGIYIKNTPRPGGIYIRAIYRTHCCRGKAIYTRESVSDYFCVGLSGDVNHGYIIDCLCEMKNFTR